MSRLRRAIHGVASGYMLLAVAAVYSLMSVPLALHYLDTERFGLWALMSSLIGYLSLVDGGMTSSAARLIIDHKDDRDGGSYGSFLKTVFAVTAVQGLIVFAVGLVFASLFGQLLGIPETLRSEFIRLFILQCGITGLGFSTRIFGLMLAGHQRMDLGNYSGMISLAVNLVYQWIFFYLGYGVFSLSWAWLYSNVASVVFQGVACGVLGFFPKPGNWGRISWTHFKEIFIFGKDLFLVAIGTQLTTASQAIIITRMLGLQTAAVWSVGLRVFNLVSQIIWRISDVSGSAFAEMMARGEITRLRERYQAMVMLTASLSGFVAVTFALCTTLFIPIWTHGKIEWPMLNSVLLAVWLILMSVSRSHGGFVLLTKQIRSMRYVYFIEGAVFVGVALLVSRWGGLPGIIACSILSTAFFSNAYNLWRVSQYFNLQIGEIGWHWLYPMVKMLLFLIPVAVLIWWVFMPLPILPRLLANAMASLVAGGIVFLRFGLPVYFQREILLRTPKIFGSILKRVFKEQ